MLDGLLYLLGQMDPSWVFVTIVVGLILGYSSKELEFEWKTIYLLLFFYLPFAVARIVAFIVGGATAVSGTGIIGIFFFTLYTICFYIGRKVAQKRD